MRVSEYLSSLQQERDRRIREAENAVKSKAPGPGPGRGGRELTAPQSSRASSARSRRSTASSCRRTRRRRTRPRWRGWTRTSSAWPRRPRTWRRRRSGWRRRWPTWARGCRSWRSRAPTGPTPAWRATPVDDEVLLRLKVYRSLGIELERDGRDGDWTRAVVRNDRRGDVHVVNMDKKFSRFFYANYFWQTL